MERVLVAKSYKELEQVGEVYSVNGKNYIKVRTAKGDLKQVKVYTKSEYKRYYGEDALAEIDKGYSSSNPTSPYYRSQKEILGFGSGFITILRGNTYACKDYLKENGFVFRKWWGWGLAGDMELPELPFGVEAIKLNWSAVAADDENLKNDEEVQKAIEALMYADRDAGSFVGTVGERLTLDVTIDRMTETDGYYGPSTLVVMKDNDGNTFCWFTSSNIDWEEGEQMTIKGTVKRFDTYKGVNTTYLNRCKRLNK